AASAAPRTSSPPAWLGPLSNGSVADDCALGDLDRQPLVPEPRWVAVLAPELPSSGLELDEHGVRMQRVVMEEDEPLRFGTPREQDRRANARMTPTDSLLV